MSSFSPDERGRRRTRSRSRSRSSRLHNKARSGSRGADGSRSTSRRRHGKRPARVTRSRSRTPDHMDVSDDRDGVSRGKWGASPRANPGQEPPRGGRSPSPYSRRRGLSPRGGRNGHGGRGGDGKMGDGDGGGFGGRNRFDHGPADGSSRNAPPPAQAPPVQRERSLSPFSKRVALTRAMNAGQR